MKKKNKKLIILISLMLVLTAILLSLTLSSCSSITGEDTVETLYIQDFNRYKVNLGSAVDLEDIKLTAVRKSGIIEKNIPITADMISDYSREKLGIVEIFVTYEGAQTKFLVEYVKPMIADIEIVSLPDPFVAIEGQQEELDLTGLVLKVRYEGTNEYSMVDGLREINTEGYSNRLEPGEHTIYITYYNKKVALPITILEKSISKITIGQENLPNKKDYIVGDVFDPTGLKIFVEYNNRTSELISYDDFPEGFSFAYGDSSSEDTFFKKSDSHYPVIVKYKNAKQTIFCRVFNPRIESVSIVDFSSIKSQPVNLDGTEITYSFSNPIPEGVRIDASSGKINIKYDDGEEDEVSLDSSLVDLYVSINQNEAANRAIDKATYRFKQSDEKIFVRYKNSAEILSFDINVVPKTPSKLEVVGLSVDDGYGEKINVLDKKYYNGQRFDDSLLRYNVLYNNGLYKHPNVQDVPIEKQHENWTRVSDGLSVESSLLLQIDPSLSENEVTVQNITYSISELSVNVSVNVYPRLVIEDSIYIKEPEKTYQTKTEIENSPDSKPIVDGGFVSFFANSGSTYLNRVYIHTSMITYFNSASIPVETFEVGKYIAQIEIMHSSIDFPFYVEYEFNVGPEKIVDFEIGTMAEGEFAPLNMEEQLIFESTSSFSISKYYARRKIEGSANYEAPEQLTPKNLYQTRKNNLNLDEQNPVLKSGNIELSIRYYGIVKKMHLYFKSQNIKGIEVMQLPKTYYYLGEEFSIEGLVVAKIDNEGKVSITKGANNFADQNTWRIEGFNSTSLGEQIITIIYQPSLSTERTTQYKIVVGDKVVDSIEFEEDYIDNKDFLINYNEQKVIPVKHKSILNTRYLKKEVDSNTGDLIDVLKTLKLKVNYSNDTFEYVELKAQYFDIEEWFEISFPEDETNLIHESKVFYAGKETKIKVLISKDINLDSMDVFMQPNNKSFIEGEDINLLGGLCELSYSFGDKTYRVVTELTSSFLNVYGYDKDITIPAERTTQIVYIGFINEAPEIKAELEVYTYRKINPTFNVLGLIVDYGVEPHIEVKINKIEQFALPEYSLEFLVNDIWTTNIPLTPGEYTVKVIIHQNSYYNNLTTTTHKLLIQRRKIIVSLTDAGKQKFYRSADPMFKNCILSQDLPLEGDVISFNIVREEGENVGEYLLRIDTSSSEENDNMYYDFVIAPSLFKIKPKEINVSDIQTLWTSANRSFDITEGATPINRVEYKLFSYNGNEITNLNDVDPGNYYIVFGNNYIIYELNSNDEKMIIESKKYEFTLSN